MTAPGASLFSQWQERRRRHHAERDVRTALGELDERLLKDIGLHRRKFLGERWR